MTSCNLVMGCAQVLQGLRIEEHVALPSQQTAFGRARVFKLRLQFFPEHLYPEEAGVTFADVAEVFKTSFMLKLQVGWPCFCLTNSLLSSLRSFCMLKLWTSCVVLALALCIWLRFKDMLGLCYSPASLLLLLPPLPWQHSRAIQIGWPQIYHCHIWSRNKQLQGWRTMFKKCFRVQVLLLVCCRQQ